MSTMITADCINCGACEPECPNSAIREGDTAYVINPALCTECVGFYGAEMCQEVCPVACCLPNQTLREDEDTLFDRAVKMHGAAELPAKAAMDGETSRFRNDDWDNEVDEDAEPAEDFSPYWED